MKEYYTIGEIHRNGLMLNHKKIPYTDKGTISRIVSSMEGVKTHKTPWGPAKMVPRASIEAHNKKFEQWTSYCPNCGGDVGECDCTLTEWYNAK